MECDREVLKSLRDILLKLSLADFSSQEEVFLYFLGEVRKKFPFLQGIAFLVNENKLFKIFSASDYPSAFVEKKISEKLKLFGIILTRESFKHYSQDAVESLVFPRDGEEVLLPLSLEGKKTSFFLFLHFKEKQKADLTFFSFLISFLSFVYVFYQEHFLPFSFLPKFLNREAVIEYVSRLMEAGRYPILVLVDINDLSFINLKYGNVVGNRVIDVVGASYYDLLESVAGVLTAGYLGSGHFLFVCERSSLEKCRERVEKNLYFSLQPEKLKVSVSVAVVDLSKVVKVIKGLDIDKLLFYLFDKLKSSSRPSVVVVEREEDIERASQEKYERFSVIKEKILTGDIHPVFQPIYSLDSKEIYAYELLSRVEENGQLKSIYIYADLLDRLNLWPELDRVVLSNLPNWLEKLNYLNGKKLFVNLSGRFLSSEKNRKFLLSLAEELPKGKVVFEITEREYLKDVNLIIKFFESLMDKGFKVAVDDFASGFSGFDYIKTFSPEFIKLDGGVIKNIAYSREDQVIVSAVKYICKEFGIKVVAEWIENEKVFEILRNMGIEFGQGYYLSPPLDLLRELK